jgi:hypothetical protein
MNLASRWQPCRRQCSVERATEAANAENREWHSFSERSASRSVDELELLELVFTTHPGNGMIAPTAPSPSGIAHL